MSIGLIKNKRLIKIIGKFSIGLIKNKNFFPSLFKNLKFIWLHRKDEFIFIHLQEHIGDIVACEPVIRYAKEKYKNHKTVWFIRPEYYSIIKCNPNINFILTVTCILEWILLKKFLSKNNKNIIIDLSLNERGDQYFPIYIKIPNDYGINMFNYYDFGALLEVFSMASGLPKLNEQPKFYLCKKPKRFIKNEYVVIHCLSNDKNRNWKKENWQKLVEYLIKKDLYIVEIGLKKEIEVNTKKYISYCGKKDFQEIAEIISQAKLFIGIDSGFAHFANALKIPSVILLGHYRNFKKYMPYTGYLAENKEKMVIQYDGKPSEIPVKLVINKIENLLQ